jgi:tetratricopeptide (TPR) repeat protein
VDNPVLGEANCGMATFLARDAELGVLLGALDEARAGRGRLIFLVGEAGIGKTRLADELCSRVPTDVRVLWGRCWEAGGAPAYWPWIEVLRPLIAEAEPVVLARELGAAAGALAALMPELRERLADLPSSDPNDSDRARFLLFDTLARFLRAAGARAPLVLILDDLHVADRPSLRLLEFVARALRNMRVLVVGTFRDADARLLPEVETLLAQIEREGERLQLRRFKETEVARFIGSMSATAPDQYTVDAILRITEGTPLYVNEVVRLVVAQSGSVAPGARAPIPDGLQPTIRGHLARVSDQTRAVLRLAAVVGREFDSALLGDLLRDDGTTGQVDFSEPLAEAQRAGLIAELPEHPGRYRFNHILIRETIYRDLGAAERERLHGRVGRVIEAGAATSIGADRFAELAHHFLRAPMGPDRNRAAIYARRAGERALDTYAHEEAAGHLQNALAVLDDVGVTADRERTELLLALADAHQRCGERARARDVCLQAAELARTLHDPEMLARTALRLGAEFSFGVVDQILVGLLEEVLAALSPTASALRARSMARLAAARQPAPNPEQPIALAKEAIALAREVGDRKTLVAVLRDARSAYLPMDDLDERTALDLETLALANETGDRLAALHTEHRLATDRLESGQIAAALAHLDQHDRIADERREPHRLWWSKFERASIHTFLGRFAEAERLLAEADASVELTQEPLARLAKIGHRATFANTSTRPFDLEATGRALSAFIAASHPAYSFWELVYRSRKGDVSYVRAACAREPLDRLPVRFSGSDHMAEMARMIDDRTFGEVLYQRMRPWARRFTNNFNGSEGSYSRPLGQLAAFLGRVDEARAHFELAIEENRRAGAVPWVVHTQVAYAEMLWRTRKNADVRHARQLLEAARAVALELDMPGIVERVKAMTDEEPDAAMRSPPPHAEPKRDPNFAITLEGEYWTVDYDSRAYRFRDSKGLQILAHLVRNPEREFHVLQLVAVADGAEGGEVLFQTAVGRGPDVTALANYQERTEDIHERLLEAEAHDDLHRAARLREELELLSEEIARGAGLGGRERQVGSSAERARINVQRRLADTLRRIEEVCPPLGRHLARTVRTGTYCVYRAN